MKPYGNQNGTLIKRNTHKQMKCNSSKGTLIKRKWNTHQKGKMKPSSKGTLIFSKGTLIKRNTH